VAGSHVNYVSDEGTPSPGLPTPEPWLAGLPGKQYEPIDFFPHERQHQANQYCKSGELIKRCCRLTPCILAHHCKFIVTSEYKSIMQSRCKLIELY